MPTVFYINGEAVLTLPDELKRTPKLYIDEPFMIESWEEMTEGTAP